MSQILCGVAAGCVMAVLWFLLVHLILTPLFPTICAWLVSLCVLGVSLHHSTIDCRRISEFLLLKDMSQIPNYLWYEYTSVRQENRLVG